ncbi:MAG TPA: Crp/Fnr family transcriptional regulator [Anaerolineaceae bacterium]|nr:Crp/Fnr family transcriptional regulator [Anaerolineaceae bacterium]
MYRQDWNQPSVFDGLSREQLRSLDPILHPCQFPADLVVFEQGAPAKYLYLLLAGEVMIQYKPYDGPSLTVARIFPGGVFGWSAALGRQAYTSAAITAQPSETYRIRGSDLRNLCERVPETGAIFLDRLASVIAERLRNTHSEILAMLNQGIDPTGECSKRIFK